MASLVLLTEKVNNQEKLLIVPAYKPVKTMNPLSWPAPDSKFRWIISFDENLLAEKLREAGYIVNFADNENITMNQLIERRIGDGYNNIIVLYPFRPKMIWTYKQKSNILEIVRSIWPTAQEYVDKKKEN